MFDPFFFHYWRERMGPLWWRVYIWSPIVGAFALVAGFAAAGLI